MGDRGLSTLGSGRLCASSAESIPRSLVITLGTSPSGKVADVGRDWLEIHKHHCWKNRARDAGETRTGGTMSRLYSSLDILDVEDVLRRLEAGPVFLRERAWGVYTAEAFDR